MSLRLPDDIDQRLSGLAALTGRSKTFYAIEAIAEHIDDLEDAHLARDVRDRVRAGLETKVPLSDLLAEYGLDG